MKSLADRWLNISRRVIDRYQIGSVIVAESKACTLHRSMQTNSDQYVQIPHLIWDPAVAILRISFNPAHTHSVVIGIEPSSATCTLAPSAPCCLLQWTVHFYLYRISLLGKPLSCYNKWVLRRPILYIFKTTRSLLRGIGVTIAIDSDWGLSAWAPTLLNPHLLTWPGHRLRL